MITISDILISLDEVDIGCRITVWRDGKPGRKTKKPLSGFSLRPRSHYGRENDNHQIHILIDLSTKPSLAHG